MLFTVRPLAEADRAWVRKFMTKYWGDEIMVVHATVYRPHELAGFVACAEDKVVGLVTYYLAEGSCEIVTLDSLREGQGIGTKLIEAVRDVAVGAGCSRVWLITTNDNTRALRFYQRRGFQLVALHRSAVAAARNIKPNIPLTGNDGIPIRDEIELELSPLEATPEAHEPM